MYKFGLSLCLTVCLFVSNKRQKVGTDWARNLCGNSQDPVEGLWAVKIEKFCLEIKVDIYYCDPEKCTLQMKG